MSNFDNSRLSELVFQGGTKVDVESIGQKKTISRYDQVLAIMLVYGLSGLIKR